MKTVLKTALVIVSIIQCQSCSMLQTASYDSYSYEETSTIKTENEKLMEQAIFSYEDYQKEVELLLIKIENIKKYEQSKPNNETTIQMWNWLTDEEKNLLNGFYRKWEKEDKLSSVFIQEAKRQVNEAFDVLLQYEKHKNTATEAKLLEFITKK